MKDKERTRGTFKIYLRRPFFLSVLTVILTVVAGAVPMRAGITISILTIVYIGIALWLYFSRRKGTLTGLIVLLSAHDQSRQNLTEEMFMPYVVAGESRYLLRMDREFAAILVEEKTSYKNITAMFPDITKEMLATGGKLVGVHSFLGDGKFHIDLRQVAVNRLGAAVADNGLEGQGSFVAAIYLVDETQTLLYMQRINDQRLVAGPIYLGNYDEVLENVEGVRHSSLTVFINWRISEHISGMNGIVKKFEKDRYFFVIK